MNFTFKILPFLLFFILAGFTKTNAQCTISNLNVETGECIEANFYSFTFNFNISQSPSDYFDLYLNGEHMGYYNLNELPITINEFSGNPSGLDTLLVCANDSEDCCADIVIENPCPCDFFNIESTVTECSEDSILFNLDFDHLGVSDSFMIGSPNGFLGTYHLNQLPIYGLAIPRLDSVNVLIQDQNNFICFNGFSVYSEECDMCTINNVVAHASDCNDDGGFYVTLSFEYLNIGNEGFSIVGNGIDYGDFEYQDFIELENGFFMDSLIIGPLIGDCETIWEFIVYDNQADECSSHTSIGPVCCENDCSIYDIVVDEIECVNNNHISFYLNLEYENEPSQVLALYSGETFVQFIELPNLPVFIEEFPINPDSLTTMTVCFWQDIQECCASIVFEVIDCEDSNCVINEVNVNEVKCDSQESIQFYLNFNVENPGNAQYELYSNDNYFGTFSLEDLPTFIEGFPLGDLHTMMTICINDQENCCFEYEFDDIDCSEYGCEIFDVDPTIFYITVDSFYVQLDFEFSNPASNQFQVFGNGIDYGSFDYDDLPILLGPYSCKDSIYLEYVIRDRENHDCRTVLDLGFVDCLVNTIDAFTEHLNIYNQGNNLIIEGLDSNHEFTTCNLIDTRGILHAQYNLDKLPRQIFTLPFLPSGIYLVQFRSEKNVFSKKLVLGLR